LWNKEDKQNIFSKAFTFYKKYGKATSENLKSILASEFLLVEVENCHAQLKSNSVGLYQWWDSIYANYLIIALKEKCSCCEKLDLLQLSSISDI